MSDLSSHQPKTFELLRGLWCQLSRKRRCQLAVLAIVMLASGMAEVISLAAVLPFLAVLINPEQLWKYSSVQAIASVFGMLNAESLLVPVTLLFGVAALLAASVRLLNLWFNGRLAAAIGSDLSCEAYRRTLCQPYEQHVKRNSSTVINTITGQVGNTVIALNAVLQLSTSMFVAICLIVALFVANALIACVAAAVFGSAYAFLSIYTRRRLSKNGSIITESSRQLVKALQEGLGAIRDVLLDHTQLTYLDIYRKADRPMRLNQAESAYIGGFPRYALEALGLLLISFLALFLTKRNVNANSIVPLLGTLALGSQRLLPALQQMYSSWSLVRVYSPSLLGVLEILRQPVLYDQNYLGISPLIFTRGLVLDEMSFGYSAITSLALEGINLEIKPGQRVGFIGTTGSGKSTLTDLLMGLLKPTSGSIFVDGVNLHDFGRERYLFAWQAAIAHVPQTIYLADSSIAENIAFGVPKEHIDLIRVKKSAEQAQISAYIETMPDSYNSFVGERGIRLSGGQRQRIGIARALYKNASILIFDEATSALDNTTEKSVLESIEALSRDLTIIIVAHRLSTIARCDRVFELNNGRLVRETTGANAALL